MSTTRVRMSPDSRREQLIELGVRLFATHSLEDLSIETLAEEAGISRGLLYHYFGGKQEFHTAVVRRAADNLFAVTAPSGHVCSGLVTGIGNTPRTRAMATGPLAVSARVDPSGIGSPETRIRATAPRPTTATAAAIGQNALTPSSETTASRTTVAT